MRVADAVAVAELIRRAFAAQPVAVDPLPSALQVEVETVARHLITQGGAIAEHGTRLVGALLWEQQGDDLHLSRLAVEPDMRRRGIALRLLDAGETEAVRRGLKELSLGTRLALTGNRRLFARAGYMEIAEAAHPGYAKPTRVELRKRLG